MNLQPGMASDTFWCHACRCWGPAALDESAEYACSTCGSSFVEAYDQGAVTSPRHAAEPNANTNVDTSRFQGITLARVMMNATVPPRTSAPRGHVGDVAVASAIEPGNSWPAEAGTFAADIIQQLLGGGAGRSGATMSQESIHSIQTVFVDKGGEGSDAERLVCSICTESFNVGEAVKQLPCTHLFHESCITPWLLHHSNTCPVCRAPIEPHCNSAQGQQSRQSSQSLAISPPQPPQDSNSDPGPPVTPAPSAQNVAGHS